MGEYFVLSSCEYVKYIGDSQPFFYTENKKIETLDNRCIATDSIFELATAADSN